MDGSRIEAVMFDVESRICTSRTRFVVERKFNAKAQGRGDAKKTEERVAGDRQQAAGSRQRA